MSGFHTHLLYVRLSDGKRETALSDIEGLLLALVVPEMYER